VRLLLLLLLAGCDSGVGAPWDFSAVVWRDGGTIVNSDGSPVDDLGVGPDLAVCPPGAAPVGLSVDFRDWLNNHGYAADDFARDTLSGGSFGGRACPSQVLAHDPVVFIHGNSDRALGAGTLTGWTSSLAYFESHGYSRAELYATTWGPADANQASLQQHSKANVLRTRRFLEAVLAYTGAGKLDVVAHSMGVTLARKAILGGSADDQGAYSVGAPLGGSIDTFVGISGANLGLTSCFAAVAVPTCDAQNGLYPGTLVGTAVIGRSAFLDNLAATSGYEGAHRYTLYSTADEIIGFGGGVYGDYTSRIPAQTAESVSSTQTHNQTKDNTAASQLSLVLQHTF